MNPLQLLMSNPLFNVYSLTAVLNRQPYIPGLIGQLGLFSPKPLFTTTALIEIAEDKLALIPEQPRGAPANRNVVGQRGIVPFVVPHFPLSDTVMADSIMGVRAFGTDNQLEAINDVVNDRLTSMGRKHDVTLEHLRLGAIKGIIVTVVDRETGAPLKTVNTFDIFGTPAPQELTWPIRRQPGQPVNDMDTPVRGLIRQLQRLMANVLGGSPLGSIAAICGANFFDAVATAPELRQTFLNTPAAATLRDNTYGLAIPYAGVLFQEYLGQVGGYQFIDPDVAYFVPVGVPDLFIEAYAPAPYLETVNTLALRRYAKQNIMDYDKGVEIETQQNVLPLCTIPAVLMRAKLGNYVAGQPTVESTPPGQPPSPVMADAGSDQAKAGVIREPAGKLTK